MLDLDVIPPSSIDLKFIEESLELIKRKRRWEVAKNALLPIINAVEKLGIEPTFTDSLNLNFAGDKAKLLAVARILRAAGFSATTNTPPKKGDTTWYAYYENPDCAERVWLYFTSSVCKRVKVGTETIQRDVYETRCGDLSSTAEEISGPSAPLLTVVPSAPELEF